MHERVFSVALIGHGYWGPILLRNFADNAHFKVKYVIDRHMEKAETVHKIVPDCIFTDQINKALEDQAVDVVVIATQASSHASLAGQALRSGKHVFVEKPFTLSVSDAEALCKLAADLKLKIWVDHTFLFNPAYKILKQQLVKKKLGTLWRFHSNRTAFGLFQSDANIFWHLFYHDAYLLLDLFPEMPAKVVSSGSAHIYPNIIDVAFTSLHYADGMHATILGDLTQPQKKRDITISGSKGSLVWDETQSSKLGFYSHSVTPESDGKRLNYIFPTNREDLKVPEDEALALEIEAFGLSLTKPGLSLCDGTKALQAMQLVEMMASASPPALTDGDLT